ncbi:MAG: acyl carrier protein [Ignavibacteriaceae bacterium]
MKKEEKKNKELISKLKSIVKPYVQDLEALENISEKTDFINDLKINSANLVDIILDVEEAYNIEIDNASMEKMLTVGAAIEIIKTKLKEK